MSNIKFVPSRIQDYPIIQELIAVLDYAENQYESPNDILYRYRDAEKVDIEIIKVAISEFGYGYIIDTLKVTDTQLKVIWYYLPLIHFLKGHKKGLELVLRLLKLAFTIHEWWEEAADTPYPVPTWTNNTEYTVGSFVTTSSMPTYLTAKCISTSGSAPYTSGGSEPVWPTTVDATVVDNEITWMMLPAPGTFELYLNVDQPNIYSDTGARLRSFVRQYVYPQLILILFYNFTAGDPVSGTQGLNTGILSVLDKSYYGEATFSVYGYGFDYGYRYGIGLWNEGIAYRINDAVVGDNGSIYTCFLAHTSTINDKPISGVNHATYWTLTLSVWQDAYAYVLNDKIIGTNGHAYICTSGHTSDSTTHPITGASYSSVWSLWE